ncbi:MULTISPECIES: hypothetical protein [Mumia]|uniref:hypothetical protein n=1 Tax=Mumia TaxID=1546255 RepID=UPI001422420F|nr:hypothetical protein [Mumia sp. ZJ430]
MFDASGDWITSERGTAWIDVVGTTVTTIGVAVAVAVYVTNTFDRRRAQAQLVSAIFEDSGKSESEHVLRVRNGSDEPVFNVFVWLDHDGGPSGPYFVSAVAPHDEVPFVDHAEDLHRLGDIAFAADMSFTDAANRKWERAGAGHKLRRARPWRRSAKMAHRAHVHAEDDANAESELDR